jgi:hypothetical protein
MDKLVSLKDKPATIEDIGKQVWTIRGEPFKLASFSSSSIWLVDDSGVEVPMTRKSVYWSKPIIIAESEYKQLTAKLEEAKGLLERANIFIVDCYDSAFICDECPQWKNSECLYKKQWLKDYSKVEKGEEYEQKERKEKTDNCGT